MFPKNRFSILFWLPLTALLAASTVNTKAAGAAWLYLILTGGFAWWQSRQTQPTCKMGAVIAEPVNTVVADVARIWLLTTGAALLLKAVPMVYWADPWGERHAEFRLLFGALGLYGLCQLPLARLRSQYLNSNYFAWVGSGLAVACALALWLVLTKGPNSAPTNRIPWAAALAMLSCLLLTLARAKSSQSLLLTLIAGSFAGLLAVLASESRGAYGIVIIWPLLGIYLFKSKFKHPGKLSTPLNGIAIIVVVSGFLVLTPTKFMEKPLHRVQDAWGEMNASNKLLSEIARTSIGSRIYMWTQSLEAIRQSPWIGHGSEGRKAHLREWTSQAGLEASETMGHLHNEYLQTLMDHGLWGLASLLSYSLGLLLMARKLAASADVGHKSLAAGLASVVFMLMSSGLSNMNFAHNYYPTVLSLAVTLLVLAATRRATPPTPSQPLTG